MPKYLILNEKNDAFRNFKKFLGGEVGTYDGYNYQLVAARGHLMTLDNPENQSSDVNFQDKVKHWADTTTIPWKLDTFKWNKKYIKSKNKYTKKQETTKPIMDKIKYAARGCDAIIIATDTDPSGEGDVLGQEIINKIGWHKTVYRCHFKDDTTASEVKRSLLQKNLVDVTDQEQNIDYIKGLARERFDYATMQMSRLATQFAREQNYDVLVTPGRLKSAIAQLVYNQIRSIDTFVPKDQYQAIFVDELGTKFINSKLAKYDDDTLANNDLTKLSTSTITVDDAKRKKTQAPKLMDFAQLSVAVAKHGYSLKNIISTYQRMYEAGILSYPRTDDDVMTTGQWEQLGQIADNIADIVGVDKSLLVNREARSRYVSKKDLDHGANRPGLTVPSSLAELEKKYGKIGAEIYTVAAKSYLATLAPDYEYDMTKAFVTDFPNFTATKNVPVKQGYKQILKDLEYSSKKKKDNDAEQFGKQAKPTINATKTTPPQKPSQKFIIEYLKREDIGTGATRVQTLSAMSDGKRAVFAIKGSVYTLTPAGYVTGAIMHNTMISSPKVTKQLTQMSKQIGERKIPLANIYKAVDVIIQKDRQTMEQNARQMDNDSYLKDKLPKKSGNQNNKYHGKLADGTEVAFNKMFMNHRFSEEECKALLAGNTINISVKTKRGFDMKISGKLKHQSFKGRDGKMIKSWGFYVPAWNKK